MSVRLNGSVGPGRSDLQSEFDRRFFKPGFIDRRELGSLKNLKVFYRAAGLPAALVISILAHAVTLWLMPFQIEKRPTEHEAYLVTFEFGASKGPEAALREVVAVPSALEAAPIFEGIPPREEPPPLKGQPLREEQRTFEDTSVFEPPLQAEQLPEPVPPDPESGRLEPERQIETGKPENETVVLEKAAQVKEMPSPVAPRPQMRISSERVREAAVNDAAVNDELNRRIEKEKVYPPGARRQGIQGTVLCTLEVGPSGALVGIEVLKSSGSKILDNAAVDLLKRVFPIGNPAGKPFTLEKAIRYRLVE